jgi:hypothetical protein
MRVLGRRAGRRTGNGGTCGQQREAEHGERSSHDDEIFPHWTLHGSRQLEQNRANDAAIEISADTLVTAGIVDVVRWPIVTEEIATALDRGAALKRPRDQPQRPAALSEY